MARSKHSNEEFIRIWQSCSTVPEVVEKLGVTYGCAHQRAMRMRERGVPLKYMTQKTNWEELAKLAKECE